MTSDSAQMITAGHSYCKAMTCGTLSAEMGEFSAEVKFIYPRLLGEVEHIPGIRLSWHV